MVWGGIAGTLPDLDVLSGLVTDPMSALAYHRAFTHSISFAVLAAPLLGLTVHRIYGGRTYALQRRRLFYPLILLAFWVLLVMGSYLMPIPVFGIPAIAAVMTLVFGAMCGAVGAWDWWRGSTPRVPTVGAGGWTILFFAAIVTHPLLDCFTSYGTQLLQPFTALRVAWNTVSVVDPLYTLPFLLLLLIAAFRGRGTRVRRRLNTAGLVVSSAYLLLTAVNHYRVGTVLDDTLRQRGLAANRSVLGPTLGNNLLWTGTAQVSDDTFYVGQYSILDREPVFSPFTPVAGHRGLLVPYREDRGMEILRWFTQDYYMVRPGEAGTVTLSDLRYGALGDDPTVADAYLFTWQIDTTVRPVRVMQREMDFGGDRQTMLSDLWKRLLGN